MKRYLIYLLLPMLVLSLVACNEDEEEVDESFTPAPFSELCDPGAFSSGIVVNTQEAYDALTFPADCDTPQIDFGSQTLLGIRTSISGCEVSYTRDIVRSPELLTYTVTAEATGACEQLNPSNNWILVSKVGPNTTVEFEVVQ